MHVEGSKNNLEIGFKNSRIFEGWVVSRHEGAVGEWAFTKFQNLLNEPCPKMFSQNSYVLWSPKLSKSYRPPWILTVQKNSYSMIILPISK